ncbi:LOW QUALITY PROTEIN: SAM-dependent methyltransferase YafE [Geomicrobium sp. JCM 19039]|nr:LOW QUALITY PROTEIN: SAM-dependent methyltransferase YafE [Geomicrobium sp. JCM 19039]
MSLSNFKKTVQQTFSSASANYVTSQLHAKGEDLGLLVAELEHNQYERLLDIATGAGHVSLAAAPHVNEVTAMDLTKEMLETAEAFITKNGFENVSFVEGDAEKLDFPDSSYDVAVCRIAAHHFERPDRFLEGAHRVIQPGGSLYILDNTAPDDDWDTFYNTVEKKRDPSHFRAWKKSEWVQMVERAGFTVERVQRFTKTFLFTDWCDRLDVPNETRKELTDLLLASPDDHKQKFNIITKRDELQSFAGESILLHAVKN